MLKKTITFEDYNGKEVTEDFYFNLSKAELIELEVSEEGGFAELLQKIVDSNDGQQIINHFKKLIMMAVGQKSPDGRRFIKSEEIRQDFAQTDAYSTLFIELATDAEAAANFVNGIVPAGLDLAETPDVAKRVEETIELPTAPPQLEAEDKSKASPEKTFDDYTRAELLSMPDAEFRKLVPNNPQQMTKDQLVVSMQRKNATV